MIGHESGRLGQDRNGSVFEPLFGQVLLASISFVYSRANLPVRRDEPTASDIGMHTYWSTGMTPTSIANRPGLGWSRRPLLGMALLLYVDRGSSPLAIKPRFASSDDFEIALDIAHWPAILHVWIRNTVSRQRLMGRMRYRLFAIELKLWGSGKRSSYLRFRSYSFLVVSPRSLRSR